MIDDTKTQQLINNGPICMEESLKMQFVFRISGIGLISVSKYANSSSSMLFQSRRVAFLCPETHQPLSSAGKPPRHRQQSGE